MQASARNFGLHVLFYVESEAIRSVIESNLAYLTESFTASELTTDLYTFETRLVSDQVEFAESIVEFYFMRNGAPTLVVSDKFIESAGSDAAGLSSVATVLIGFGAVNAWPCQAIALVEKDTQLQSPLASILNFRQRDIGALREELRRYAIRASLLFPAMDEFKQQSRPPLEMKSEFSVHVAQSMEDLNKSFQLRRKVYGLMGYLTPEVERSQSGIEIDYHDGMALHFIAVHNPTGEIAGTLRLIFPQQPSGQSKGADRGWRDILKAQQSWVKTVAHDIPEADLRSLILNSGPACLPFLENIRPTNEWRSLLPQAFQGAEFSRLIVLPKFRAFGLSRALMQFMISACVDLRRSMIFAECQPAHTPMYTKYGFKEIEGRVSHALKSHRFNISLQDLVLELNTPKGTLFGEVARWNGALFKMANPQLEALHQQLGKMDLKPEDKHEVKAVSK